MASHNSNVLSLLIQIEEELQRSNLWPIEAPEEAAFLSHEPFSIDTMSAEQWLKWVFLPRMIALIETEQPLPTKIALTPYFEEALPEGHDALLALLAQCDHLLNQN